MAELSFYFLFLPALLLSIHFSKNNTIAPEGFAKLFSYLVSMDATCGLFFPITSFSWLGVKIENGSAGHLFCEVTGAHAAGLAVTSYLVTTQKTPMVQAVAFGHLARLIGITKLIFTGRVLKLGLNVKMVSMISVSLAVLAYNLFFELWEPLYFIKLNALFMCIGGAVVMSNPITSVKVAHHYDIKDKTSADIVRFAGFYVFMNGLYLSLVGNHIDPFKAVGFSSLTMIPFILFMQTLEIKGLFGMGKEFMLMMIVILMSTISAATLL